MLLASVFIVATCTIFYELLIGSISSYFLGSSILHFSLTIGLFLFFMGVGSFLSKFITERLLPAFITIEIAIGLFGGLSAAILYAAFSLTNYFYLAGFLLIASISIGAGLEIPLITRMIRRYGTLSSALANALAFDYIGGLIASILFPLVLLPYLGLMKTAFVVGMLNLSVAAVNAHYFRHELKRYSRYIAISLLGIALLGAGLFQSLSISSFFEQFLYQDQILYSAQTPYQRIIITRFKNDIRLFLNGDLQFSSIDEYRYHEALVHPALSMTRTRERVLILGGGDGLALREILKYPDVKEVTMVDIDKQMTDLGREHPLLVELNGNSMSDERLRIINADAGKYLEETTDIYSVIIIDLPDPNDLALGKLYSQEFYGLVSRHLDADGVMVAQSTSPYFSRKAYWSINETLGEVFDAVVPYTVHVPTFGQWGMNMAANRPLELSQMEVPVPVRYLDADVIPTLFVFDADTSRVEVDANKLDNQVLVQYYEESVRDWR